ncbi:SGNH/GDSL hydrolase family protein [Paenibacillus ginsengarvi]|uniref:Uncharacterized protein n=1 Tax=Paenibacillus ginsengarvi TaxID=400777 RepID=A0A3B0AV87_9BACL|nr:SGNH/GDSL hydrolase family protein [Paenibacillus ginsengarvi]RKN64450.1 hypothetical protein D7M11_33885 [Paenibacillus ginsengarvi]
MSVEHSRTYPQATRVAFAGDSITWVDGLLDEGFVGEADRYIRDTFAETLTHDKLLVSGQKEALSSRKFYGGGAWKLTGSGSGAAFTLEGDELTVVQGKERGNEAATLIDLYVDGVLYDTFSNLNESPSGEEAVRFAADGAADTFDLGRPFTYAHNVTVDGEAVAGHLSRSGYGGAFPRECEYIVIRIYGAGPDGEPEVHHALKFRQAPATGAVIEASFRYGETIAYVKSTVGEAEERLGSPLESRYGEGGVAFDPARPVAVSSGLDFRETESRAIRTWRFPHAAKRSFELKIRGFDPRGGCTGEPYGIVNFVTNRFHAVMNAGIGGWTARLFLGDRGLRSAERIANWKPDIVFIGLGTNDDWEAGNGFVASRRVEGLSEAGVRGQPALFIRNCRYVGPDRYSIDTAELVVASCTPQSVTIDRTDMTDDGIKPGDIIVVGDYYGDNRNVQNRMIESWDPLTGTAFFADPLAPTRVTPHISDYAGQAVRIKCVEGYVSAMERMIGTIRAVNPEARIALIETGLSNYNTRLLTGYPEAIRDLARRCGLELAEVYRPLLEWQYKQPHDLQGFIGSVENTMSDGSADYPIVSASGRDLSEEARYQLRNWSVRVDGDERYGDGCRIEGGFALAFAPTAAPEQLTITEWDGRSRNPKMAYRFIPSRLVFTRNIPPAGARIEVSVSSAKWSPDDAHLGLPGGGGVYAKQVKAALSRMFAAE